MKVYILISFIFIMCNLSGQRVMFLHHSTGGYLLGQGDVREWIADYNSTNGTDYVFNNRYYPTTPYPWQNYPYDYWHLWINGGCDNSDPDIECFDKLCSENDVIIYKHCYPGAHILADIGSSSVSYDRKSLENYKLQYKALLSLMDTYPDNKFIIWTLVPLHRLDTNSEEAARANEFVEWVKYDWLAEDNKSHPNVYIFDFFGYAAEIDSNPSEGMQYCLKYEYEADHSDEDSHPNELGNQTIGPIFAEFVINTIEDSFSSEDNSPPSIPTGISLNSFTYTSFFFSWTASTDNVGVTGYNVYRDGTFLESTSELSFTDNTVSGCLDYSYTISAFDAAGNESSQSEALVVNPCAPDVTPTITLSPNVANGVTTFELIVRVTELNNINTNGDIIVHIPKDQHWDLSESYNASLASLGGTSLNNSEWSYSEDTDNHIFTFSTTILAGSFSAFGFRISFDPGSSTGMNPITSQLVSGGGGEVHVSNNSDSEQLDYFQ